MQRKRLPILLAGLVGASLALSASPASARLNPPDWSDWNCALETSGQDGAAWESRGTLIGFLYYGADDDVHGTSGSCEWLADSGVKAVQSRWIVSAQFSVPVSRYRESSLPLARGKMRFTAMSDAQSRVVTSETNAGSLGVDLTKGVAGIEIGGSNTRKFATKMRTGQDRNVSFSLTSRPQGICEEKERSTKRVQVFCTWTLGVGTFSWLQPRGRTDGGLQIMALRGKLTFPGARSVTLEGIFQDQR